MVFGLVKLYIMHFYVYKYKMMHSSNLQLDTQTDLDFDNKAKGGKKDS